jgi:GT2 family glycosyltransferase
LSSSIFLKGIPMSGKPADLCPDFSVIISTFNRREMLANALNSILLQTYQNFEIIVVNDGGEDITDVIQSLDSKERIISLRHDENQGVAASRNTALKAAKGKYITYLDDDDIYYQDHLAVVLDELQKDKFKVVYTDSDVITQVYQSGRYEFCERKTFGSIDFDFKRLLVSNYIPTLNMAHLADILNNVGYFDESLRSHEDWDLWIRMARKYDFYHIRKVTTALTKRSDNTSQTSGHRKNFFDTYKVVQQRYKHLIEDEETVEQQAQVERLLFIHAEPEITREIQDAYFSIHRNAFLSTFLVSKTVLAILPNKATSSGKIDDFARVDMMLKDLQIGAFCKVLNRIHLPFENIKKHQGVTYDVILILNLEGEQDFVADLMIEMDRLLDKDGLLLTVLPNYSSQSGIQALNQKKLSVEDYKEVLRGCFKYVSILGQGINTISSIFLLEDKPHAITEFRVERDEARYYLSDRTMEPVYYLIACSSAPLPERVNMCSCLNDTSKTLLNHLKEIRLTAETIVRDKDQVIHDLQIYIQNKDHNISELKEMISEKDRLIDDFQTIDSEKDNHISNFQNSITEKNEAIDGLQVIVHEKDIHIHNFLEDIKEKDHHISYISTELAKEILYRETLEKELAAIKHSRVWRIGEWCRGKILYIKKLGKLSLVQHFFFEATRNGLRSAFFSLSRLLQQKLGHRQLDDQEGSCMDDVSRLTYRSWLEQESLNHDLTDKHIELEYRPRITLILPVGRNQSFPIETIVSVQSQFYEKWELFIVGTTVGLKEELPEYETDQRIKFVNFESELNFSAAVNEGMLLGHGEYIGVLTDDVILSPVALYFYVRALNDDPSSKLLYSDEDQTDHRGNRIFPVFKPDYSPELLLCLNYISKFYLFSNTIADQVGGYNHIYEGWEDYDFLLRFAKHVSESSISHIPEILYHIKTDRIGEVSNKECDVERRQSLIHVLSCYLERNQIDGRVVVGENKEHVRIERTVNKSASVGIIIPFRDKVAILKTCIDSILSKTTFPNYHIYLVDNQSKEAETLKYLKEIEGDNRLTVIQYDHPFNYSAVNNLAVTRTETDYLLFLNNDTELITPGWIEGLLEQAQRKKTGAVGALLFYPDNSVQHAGIVIGVAGVAGHIFRYKKELEPDYLGWFTYPREVSAVTAACLMVRRYVFNEVDGFDESFQVNFNDVDLCLKIRERGYVNMFIPSVRLIHHERLTREKSEPNNLLGIEMDIFRRKWIHVLKNPDPYLNKNIPMVDEAAMNEFIDKVCLAADY